MDRDELKLRLAVRDRIMRHDIIIHRVEETTEEEEPADYFVAYFRDIGLSPCSGVSDENPMSAVFSLLHETLPDVIDAMVDGAQGGIDPFAEHELLGGFPKPTYDEEFTRAFAHPDPDEVRKRLEQTKGGT